jgi:hypothetical protein
MSKRIHHMGMTLTRNEHEEFHKGAPDLSPKQHEAFMKRMGITKEQDEEWRRTHLTLGEQRAQGLIHVEPAAIGAGFVEWCVKQGWLVRRGTEYFASKEGDRELGARFDIAVERAQRR